MAVNEVGGEVVVRGSGHVSSAAHTYARDKIAQVVRRAPRPVLFAKVDLIAHADPGRNRHALAKAELDVSGTIVRAHVEAGTMLEAIDRLEARLGARIDHLQARAPRRHDGQHSWHHGDVPTERRAYFPRPADEREIVRRKTFAVDALTPEEAAFDIVQLDHDFYLFRDAGTDRDAVIQRAVDGTIGSVLPSPIGLDDAVELLDLGDLPFVFFRDPATSRGAVVYRRYDGHYGVVTPAD